MQEEKIAIDKKEDVFGYTVAMSLARQMQGQGIISADDYAKIERAMQEKYCINISSIYRQIAG